VTAMTGRAKIKKRKPRKHNPAAQTLRTPQYRPRIVKSKKVYRRKPKQSESGE
jgi:hypothetical protein